MDPEMVKFLEYLRTCAGLSELINIATEE